MKNIGIKILIIIAVFFLQSCYTFKGFSIDPNVKTFYISNFDNKAALAPPAFGQDFSERLRNRVRDEARLKFDDSSPDVEFSGIIKDYQITPEAARPGEGSYQNVLAVVVSVEHINSKNEKASYKKDYSFTERFSADADLQSIQDDINKKIINGLITNIFNETFNNW